MENLKRENLKREISKRQGRETSGRTWREIVIERENPVKKQKLGKREREKI